MQISKKSMHNSTKMKSYKKGEDYYKDSLRVLEGPVLPCGATAESVIENAQGMVVPMTFMNTRFPILALT